MYKMAESKDLGISAWLIFEINKYGITININKDSTHIIENNFNTNRMKNTCNNNSKYYTHEHNVY